MIDDNCGTPWLKIRIQRAKITMGTIFGPFISILSQKNILGQNMKNCRIFLIHW